MGCKYHQRKCNSQTYTFYFSHLLEKTLAVKKAEFAYNLTFKTSKIPFNFDFFSKLQANFLIGHLF